MKNILVIAPHPDDEILGCGGMIRRSILEGDQVYVLIATRGNPAMYSDEKVENIRKEARKAHAQLGVKETVFLDFYAPELDTTSQAAISRHFSEAIKRLKINVLYLPHRGDIHHDHSAVFSAGLVAARPVGNYSIKEIYCYETLSETEWAPPFGDDAFIPNAFMDVSEVFKDKLDALSCFKSQMRPFPGSRSLEAIEALAKFRGATVGVKRAEAFMIMRIIK